MGLLSKLGKYTGTLLGGGIGFALGGPVGAAIGAGLGYSSDKSSQYADEAVRATKANTYLQKQYLDWLKDYYNKVYGGMAEGDWNNPLYAGAKSDAERAYRKSVDNTMRVLSARGLGSSGLLGRYLQQSGYNIAAMLSGLKPQLLTQAGNFIRGTGGAYAQTGQGLLGQANLYNQYAQAYGAPIGNLLGLAGAAYLL